MTVALYRWLLREPGALVEHELGWMQIDGYSPCFRRVYFHPFRADPDLTATAAWRGAFNAGVIRQARAA